MRVAAIGTCTSGRSLAQFEGGFVERYIHEPLFVLTCTASPALSDFPDRWSKTRTPARGQPTEQPTSQRSVFPR